MKKLIYSRKSLFTGKGDSVENQVQLCLSYAASHFGTPPDGCRIFEDEGFSAKDTERPQFQALRQAARTGEYDCLICYRLDRVSRSVSDFSSFIGELQKLGIAFVSIREQFDTATPMGRAMMYIASVFAQLERETLAERVRDNLYQLAKSGRWLGGITPLGYRSQEVAYTEKGRNRTLRVLAPVDKELAIVSDLYAQFLARGSLSQVDAYCLKMGLKTRGGNNFTRFSLRGVLENPVYAAADQTMYDWLLKNGYEVYMPQDAFDGSHGLLAYCKTRQAKHMPNKKRAPGEWIVSIGVHPGLIAGESWVLAQDIIQKNKERAPRSPRSTDALLSGLLRCGNCGSFMRPKGGRTLADGTKTFYYCCELKERSKQAACAQQNAPGPQSDAAVIKALAQLAGDSNGLYEVLQNDICIEKSPYPLQVNLQARIADYEATIQVETQALQNIARAISKNNDEALDAVLLSSSAAHSERIQTAQAERDQLIASLHAGEGSREQCPILADTLKGIEPGLACMDWQIKRALLQSLVKQARWDGDTIFLSIKEAESLPCASILWPQG
ncbi:MAG: recombinase family protein [Candidatus Pelethousia sp.]|nr:recombinase family protein [Candidatus Pelethousia sp.]